MKRNIEIPNKITVETTLLNNVLKYKILNQSEDFTAALREHDVLTDENTGFSLKSHNKPNYSNERRRFYVRGREAENNNREVRVSFEDRTQAREALNSLELLLTQVIPEDEVMLPDHPGSTTACRMAIISRDQAQRLSLTAKDYYPDQRRWGVAEPHVIPNNFHFTEHIAQIVDVLNKAEDPNYQTPRDENYVNAHRVDHESCEAALAIIRNAFDEAEDNDEDGKTLIALWRIVSGLRAPDVDENGDGRERNPH